MNAQPEGGDNELVATPTLLGIPYDASSSHIRGAAGAPVKIREALRNPGGNAWSEGLVDIAAPGIMHDAGDVEFPQDADPRQAIELGVARVIAAGGVPIAVGGDHSVTYPIVRAVRQRQPRLTILHIDAHPDLYDEFAGDRYSHACPFARIMEAGLVDRLVQVGIRTMTGHQRDQASRFGVDVIDMRAWAQGKRPRIDGPVYLSIDLDGIDPAFAPGVAHPEPGGLTVREAITLVQNAPSLVGADVVEYNPARDAGNLTALVAAKLVKEIASTMHRST